MSPYLLQHKCLKNTVPSTDHVYIVTHLGVFFTQGNIRLTGKDFNYTMKLGHVSNFVSIHSNHGYKHQLSA